MRKTAYALSAWFLFSSLTPYGLAKISAVEPEKAASVKGYILNKGEEISMGVPGLVERYKSLVWAADELGLPDMPNTVVQVRVPLDTVPEQEQGLEVEILNLEERVIKKPFTLKDLGEYYSKHGFRFGTILMDGPTGKNLMVSWIIFWMIGL